MHLDGGRQRHEPLLQIPLRAQWYEYGGLGVTIRPNRTTHVVLQKSSRPAARMV